MSEPFVILIYIRSFFADSWTLTENYTMGYGHFGAATVQLSETLWILAGGGSNTQSSSYVETFTEEAGFQVEDARLPDWIRRGCGVRLSDTEMLLIGELANCHSDLTGTGTRNEEQRLCTVTWDSVRSLEYTANATITANVSVRRLGDISS